MIKKLAYSLATAAVLLCGVSAPAQDYKELMKERKEISKLSKKELNEKASKAARKEAKRLAKEGWEASIGALPIEKQLDRAYMMQYELDGDMTPKYIMGDARSIGGNYDAAKVQALELAKQNLAGQIQSEITALIESTVANNQLSAEQVETITKSVVASKGLISQSLGRTLPVIEMSRTLKNRNKEVMVRIAYSSEMARKAVRKAVERELADEGDELHKKLDEILGWN